MNKLHLSALAAALLATALAATPTSKPMTGHDMNMGDHTMKTTAYQPYSKAAFDAAKGMRRVLFFHATWCPNCKAADADLTKNLAGLPKNVVVFKTDYDKETALKRQYGITSQHTFVLVDAGGKALAKWSGGGVREIAAKTGMVR